MVYYGIALIVVFVACIAWSALHVGAKQENLFRDMHPEFYEGEKE